MCFTHASFCTLGEAPARSRPGGYLVEQFEQ